MTNMLKSVADLTQAQSILANLAGDVTPLTRAYKIQQRCATVGFDWDELLPVVDKIHEEIDEVLQEVNQVPVDQHAVEEELGDLLFAVVNLSRHLQVDPEVALNQACDKFTQRFMAVEQAFQQQGKTLEQASLNEMEAVWQQVKKGC